MAQNKKVLILFALGLIILICFGIFDSGRIQSKLGELKGENKILLQNNEELKSNINKLLSNIEKTDSKIDSFYKIEQRLTNQYRTIQFNIKNLKPQYDKANNFTANYNADSIRLYFSKLK